MLISSLVPVHLDSSDHRLGFSHKWGGGSGKHSSVERNHDNSNCQHDDKIVTFQRTLERPKVVSEVIFLRFCGVVCNEKCFQNWVSVIGSVVSEISQFAQFYVIWAERNRTYVTNAADSSGAFFGITFRIWDWNQPIHLLLGESPKFCRFCCCRWLF